jgi:hypothetical protein
VEQKNFKRSLWLGIGIITVSIIVFGVAFYILAGDIASSTNAIISGRDEITEQSAFINSYSSLKENASAVSAYQGAMDQLLASQDNLISFPSQLDGVSRNDNVTIAFSFQGDPVPATSKAPGYVGFHLDVAGSLGNLTAFLKDMESSAPILLSKIDTFDLSQNGPGYALAIDGRVFFR